MKPTTDEDVRLLTTSIRDAGKAVLELLEQRFPTDIASAVTALQCAVAGLGIARAEKGKLTREAYADQFDKATRKLLELPHDKFISQLSKPEALRAASDAIGLTLVPYQKQGIQYVCLLGHPTEDAEGENTEIVTSLPQEAAVGVMLDVANTLNKGDARMRSVEVV
jgi:hypothetical protein